MADVKEHVEGTLGQLVDMYSEKYLNEPYFAFYIDRVVDMSRRAKMIVKVAKYAGEWGRNYAINLIRPAISQYVERYKQDNNIRGKIEVAEKKDKEKRSLEQRMREIGQRRERALREFQSRITDVKYEADSAKRDAEDKKRRITSELSGYLKQKEQDVQQKAIDEIKRQLNNQFTMSGLVKSNSEWSDIGLANKLKEVFLGDLLEDLGQSRDSGYKSYMTGLCGQEISEIGFLESHVESEHIIWHRTLQSVMQQGRTIITDEDLVVAKFRQQSPIYTAFVMDRSGSMDWNHYNKHRQEVKKIRTAKSIVLAGTKAVEEISTENKSIIYVFNNETQQVTPAELLNIKGTGGTDYAPPIIMALEGLKRNGADYAIIYFITDGLPNDIDRACKAAEMFKDYPNYYLRVIHINPDRESAENLEKIAMHAGKAKTRFIPVDLNEAGQVMLKDLAKTAIAIYETQAN